MLVLLIILFLVCFGGLGYGWYGRGTAAPAYGPYGLVGIIVVFALLYYLFRGAF